jgi:hypothetical protein
LSTKNATELPKCSKTLHFRVFSDSVVFCLSCEQKTNKPPENDGIERCFEGWFGAFWVGIGYLTPFSPGIGHQGAAVGGYVTVRWE